MLWWPMPYPEYESYVCISSSAFILFIRTEQISLGRNRSGRHTFIVNWRARLLGKDRKRPESCANMHQDLQVRFFVSHYFLRWTMYKIITSPGCNTFLPSLVPGITRCSTVLFYMYLNTLPAWRKYILSLFWIADITRRNLKKCIPLRVTICGYNLRSYHIFLRLVNHVFIVIFRNISHACNFYKLFTGVGRTVRLPNVLWGKVFAIHVEGWNICLFLKKMP